MSEHLIPFPESEPDLPESTAPLLPTGRIISQRQQQQQQQITATTAAPPSQQATAVAAKGRPLRPAFEIQYNTETDGAGAGGSAARSAAAFAPTGGAFRLIEVSSAVPPPQKDVDIKVLVPKGIVPDPDSPGSEIIWP